MSRALLVLEARVRRLAEHYRAEVESMPPAIARAKWLELRESVRAMRATRERLNPSAHR